MNTGEINIRKTHPNLYWLVMTLALVELALGVNFAGGTLASWFPSPTFPIYEAPNILWGAIFLGVSLSKFVFLNVYRRLRLVRLSMAIEVGFMLFLAWGTAEPGMTSKGSFQLPIIYAGLALLQVPLLLEPFINPLTARWKQ